MLFTDLLAAVAGLPVLAAGKRSPGHEPHTRHGVKGITTYRLSGALDRVTVGGGCNWKSRYGFEGAGYPEQGSYLLLSAMTRYGINQDLSATLNASTLLGKKDHASITDNSVYGEPGI